SNSFGSQGTATASGLLKLEMMVLNCKLLQIAESVAVPAGKALAVDRDQFSTRVTEAIQAHPLIEMIPEECHTIPSDSEITLFATGPMTSPGLIETFGTLLNQKQLYFFDAAAPIIVRDSIDFDIAFFQDRYGEEKQSEIKSYINCPLSEDEYKALLDKLLTAERTELKDFEAQDAKYFESCLPVEVIASRGPETLRFGPMKPVGLIDPRTGKSPHAVVQLRQDNQEGTLYNMVGFQTNLKWGVQKEMIQMIPGLENAEVVRYGVMHRNTFINSPEVLLPTLQLKKAPNLFFAGQLTGTEGYTESIATGLFAALNIANLVMDRPAEALPKETMLGALLAYITRPEAIGESFQPINSNWGILPALPPGSLSKKKDKITRNKLYAERSLETIKTWFQQNQVECLSLH
ncbi:MAG: methylenetetrahydrofolate--tRNA-(uracil(54)-C(5))-methyltransferase (FADH(2)-oxidizing) TrmFO, partial [Cyanobacteria bacterium]|nr:methylenetetrahydrofolate--tRNA-(uracil(54)-C(5))-methyltransferase (FADH(2)-oxidizing) TrmFO [Cyanobacteriota bacterium]